jgi:hypothetical protein
MTTGINDTKRSRRALMTAGIGAAAAAAAAAIARAVPVSAADGDTVTVGSSHEGSDTTAFTVNSHPAIEGTSKSSRGVNGFSTSGQGVHGESSSSAGVSGVSATGNAVHGRSESHRGIYGESNSGIGVAGSGATGVHAASTDGGYALDTSSGRVRFGGISGVATIPAGHSEHTVKPGVSVDSKTLVLLTGQHNNGGKSLWYQTKASENAIIIHMDSAATEETRIAYLILEHA